MTFEYDFQNPDIDIEKRLDDLISQLTLEEKCGFIPCKNAAVERLGIAEYDIGSEGTHGFINRDDEGTTFPQTIGLAASFDRELLALVGEITGNEARAYYNTHGKKRGTSLWFPTVDLERSPYWGRTEEGYGEDPYLTGELAKSLIRSAQNDKGGVLRVTAAPKHFFANNNETNRQDCNCSIPPRLIREYYTVPFKAAVKDAGAYSLMTSYNEVNGTPMLLNPMINDLVKGEWGLEGRGHVVTDGDDFLQTVTAHHYFDNHADTIAHTFKNGGDGITDIAEDVIAALRQALDCGKLTEEELDKHIRSILRVRMRLGHFDPSTEYDGIGREIINSTEHIAAARRAADESVILLKNKNGALPIKEGSRIAVLGFMATQVHMDWYTSPMAYKYTVMDGLRERFGEDNVDYLETRPIVSFRTRDGLPVVMKGEHNTLAVGSPDEAPARFFKEDWGFGSCTLRSVDNGMLMDRGYNLLPNQRPDEQLRKMAQAHPVRVEGRNNSLGWFVQSQMAIIPQGGSKVALRCYDGKFLTNAPQGEFIGLELPYAQGERHEFIMETIDTVGEALGKLYAYDTVLTVTGSNPMIHGRECIDRPSLYLPAADEALHLEAARRSNKSVALMITSYPYDCLRVANRCDAVVTMAHAMQELGHAVADVLSGDVSPAGRCPMSWVNESDHGPESVMEYDIMHGGMTYLWDKNSPIFPFGHGLTYTEFEYSNIFLTRNDKVFQVSFTLTNTGEVDSDEVPQLYVKVNGSAVPRPLKQLKGFDRVHLKSGESRDMTFIVPIEEIAVWDTAGDRFVVERGIITFMVGASSEDIRLRADALIGGESLSKRELTGFLSAWKCDDYCDCEFVEKRGSALPAVKADKDFGGELIFERCIGHGDTTVRVTCAGLCREGARITFVADDNDCGSVVVPYTGDLSIYINPTDVKSQPAWQTVECPVELPDGEFTLRVLIGTCAVVHGFEFE